MKITEGIRMKCQKPRRRLRRTSHRQNGYSLVEMAVVIILLGITLMASIPAFSRLMQSNSLQNAANQFSGHMRLARQRAVATGVPYIVDWDSTETYLLVRDDNGNDIPDDGEPADGPFTLPKRIHLENSVDDAFTSSLVTFTRDGSASESGTLVLSNDRGHALNLILLAPTGQVRID
jgi:prepilin-type N-terminal cleavage/methylation domain-containing protein